MANDDISLRPVSPDDEAFIVDVYGSTRADEMALTGWSAEQQLAFIKMQAEAQRRHYKAYYPEGEHNLILLNGQPVGRVYTAEKEDEIRILDIALVASHRNSGIGTPIIRDILARGQETGKPVRIYVESYNRSLALFERLGFTKVEDDGVNLLLEWRPSA